MGTWHQKAYSFSEYHWKPPLLSIVLYKVFRNFVGSSLQLGPRVVAEVKSNGIIFCHFKGISSD